MRLNAFVLVGMIFGIYISNSVTKNLFRLVEATTVVSEGDLRQEIVIRPLKPPLSHIKIFFGITLFGRWKNNFPFKSGGATITLKNI